MLAAELVAALTLLGAGGWLLAAAVGHLAAALWALLVNAPLATWVVVAGGFTLAVLLAGLDRWRGGPVAPLPVRCPAAEGYTGGDDAPALAAPLSRPESRLDSPVEGYSAAGYYALPERATTEPLPRVRRRHAGRHRR